MITIIYSHPYDGSFNHAVLESVIARLEATDRKYQLADLYKDGFNPVMTPADLKLYSKGETADELARKYLTMLENSDQVIMIFPVWWGMMPAMVKGFFDKVLLRGGAYDYSPDGAMLPALQISRTVVVTTSQSPSVMFGSFFEGYLAPMVLNSVGMTGVEWYNCDNTSHGTNEHREAFIRMLNEKI